MIGRFFRWLEILDLRYDLWRFGVGHDGADERRWAAYIRTGDARADEPGEER